MKKNRLILLICNLIIVIGLALFCYLPGGEPMVVAPEDFFLQIDAGPVGVTTMVTGDQSGHFLGPLPVTLERGDYDVVIEYSSNHEAKMEVYQSKKSGAYAVQHEWSKSIPVGMEQEFRYPVRVRYGEGSFHVVMKLADGGSAEHALIVSQLRFEKNVCFDMEFFILGLLLIAAAELLILDLFVLKENRKLTGEKRTLAYLFAGTCLVVNLPLFTDYLIAGNDITFHLSRIEGLMMGIKDGQFPVRIQPGWADGNGYGVSIFYGELLLYIPAFLRMIGFGVMNAHKAYLFLMNVGTLAVAWGCFGKMAGSRKNGLIAAIIYTAFPYRLMNIYIRSAVGEFSAMLFLPVIAYALYLIYSEAGKKEPSWKKALLLAAGCTGVLQVHTLSCAMVAVFCILFAVVLWKKTVQKSTIFTLLQAVGLTLLANLWFLVPMADYLLTQELNVGKAGYGEFSDGWMQRQGASLAQLFLISAGTGTGSSDMENGIYQEFSLYIGLAAIAVVAAVILRGNLNKKEKISLGLFGISAFMSTDLFPYDLLRAYVPFLENTINKLQFPWRFLTMSALFAGILACLFLQSEKTVDMETAGSVSASAGSRIPLGKALVCLALVQALYLTSQFMVQSTPWRIYDSVSWSRGWSEFAPSAAPYDVPDDLYANAEGVSVTLEDRDGVWMQVAVDNQSGQDAGVIVPFLYYRDYRAEDAATGEALETVCSDGGQVQVQIPSGFTGSILVQFQQPVSWILCNIVSAVTWLLQAGWFVRCRFVKRVRQSKKVSL